ncbi:PC4/YdbC family ssDNA-binding protein, partial [Ruminococcus sp.]
EHAPKYDIRDWSPDHTRMAKGVTLTDEELEALKAILNGEVEDDIDESQML